MKITNRNPTSDLAIVALVTRVDQPQSADVAVITAWLVRLMMSGARSPGYWSGEIIPPRGDLTEWKLVQRFLNFEDMTAWEKSEIRARICQELEPHAQTVGAMVLHEPSEHPDSEAATAVVTAIKPGMEEEYFAWAARIQSAMAEQKGYRGVYIHPPAPGRQKQWATLIRFDSPQSLENWFGSAERRELLEEADRFVDAINIRHVSGSFPGWIPTDSLGQSPPNWKTALLVLLGLFPVVLLEMKFVSPSIATVKPVLASFIEMVGSVCTTTYVTMPLFIKWFKWWLYPQDKAPAWIDAAGTAVIGACFGAEIILLWDLIPGR